MDLVPFMFWERQEMGSQLCAQHCLNNLLQQHTYSEFDLADVARRLDDAENAALSSANQNKKSYNYDDTGYFSISVLERALEVWDLTLVRWRGEAMKAYQEHPEDQAAFILNLANHWIPLRRFSPHPPTSTSTKRWYNLNSFLPNGPEWISPTYLRLVLAQAEEEGYSVFCVRKATSGSSEMEELSEGTGWGDGGVGILPESEADRMAVILGEPVSRTGNVGSPQGNVGVGAARAPLAPLNNDQPSVDPSSVAGPSSPPARRKKRQEDLIEPGASDPYAQFQPPRPPRNPARNSSAGLDILDGETGTFPSQYDDVDEDQEGTAEPHEDPIGSYRRVQEDYSGPTDFAYQSRSYDDEDAALQAALKASMEDLPPGWEAPELKPKEKPIQKKSSISAPTPAPVQPPAAQKPPAEESGVGSRFIEELDDDDDEPTEQLTADEIRRRRLARFGH